MQWSTHRSKLRNGEGGGWKARHLRAMSENSQFRIWLCWSLTHPHGWPQKAYSPVTSMRNGERTSPLADYCHKSKMRCTNSTQTISGSGIAACGGCVSPIFCILQNGGNGCWDGKLRRRIRPSLLALVGSPNFSEASWGTSRDRFAYVSNLTSFFWMQALGINFYCNLKIKYSRMLNLGAGWDFWFGTTAIWALTKVGRSLNGYVLSFCASCPLYI